MEAKVAKEGIILARDLGLWNVVIEGDSLTTMHALSQLNKPPNSIQKVVEGALRFLQASMDGNRTMCGDVAMVHPIV